MRNILLSASVIVCVVSATGCHTTTPDAPRTTDTSYSPQPGDWRVRLTWQTETESNAFGFYVHRSKRPDGQMKVINPDTPLHATGTTTTPQRYRYYDLDVEAGETYYYKLQQVDTDGTSRFIVGADQAVPGEPKQLTEDEVAEILAKGIMYRQEAG